MAHRDRDTHNTASGDWRERTYGPARPETEVTPVEIDDPHDETDPLRQSVDASWGIIKFFALIGAAISGTLK